MEAYRRPPWAGDISGLRSLHRCLDTNASEEGRVRDLGGRGVIARRDASAREEVVAPLFLFLSLLLALIWKIPN